jgi:hypothetical protein
MAPRDVVDMVNIRAEHGWGERSEARADRAIHQI